MANTSDTQNIADGLQILLRAGEVEVHTHHRVLQALTISRVDLAALERLGWVLHEEGDCMFQGSIEEDVWTFRFYTS